MYECTMLAAGAETETESVWEQSAEENVWRGWRKLSKEQLYNLYFSTDINREHTKGIQKFT
jgi:hypothetical protein